MSAALAFIGALFLVLWFACCGCTPPPPPDAGAITAEPSRTVHVPATGCTVVVVDRPDGTEQDLCLSAQDLAPIIDARTKAGMH